MIFGYPLLAMLVLLDLLLLLLLAHITGVRETEVIKSIYYALLSNAKQRCPVITAASSPGRDL